MFQLDTIQTGKVKVLLRTFGRKTNQLRCGTVIGKASAFKGIRPDGCIHYDGSTTSTCDPVLNGRIRTPLVHAFKNLACLEHSEDMDMEEIEDIEGLGPEDCITVEPLEHSYADRVAWMYSSYHPLNGEFLHAWMVMTNDVEQRNRLEGLRRAGGFFDCQLGG